MGENPQLNELANLWMDAWTKMSQGILDVGQNLDSSHFQPSSDSPWYDAVSQLRKEFEAAGRFDELQLVEKLADQGAKWSKWADETLTGLAAAHDNIGASKENLDGWKKHLDDLKAGGVGSSHWQHQLESLRQVYPQVFQDLDVDWNQLDADGLLKLVDSNPLLDGSNRDQIRQSLRLWIEYDRQRQRHAKSLHQIGTDSLERMSEHLQGKSGSDVDSLESFFDLWVKFSEETYAEHVSSDKYSKSYADMVNAATTLGNHWQQQAGNSLSKLGVPERDELRELYRRHQDLKREHRALKKEFRAYQTSTQDQLGILQNQVEELKQRSSTNRVKKSAQKKSTKSAAKSKEGKK